MKNLLLLLLLPWGLASAEPLTVSAAASLGPVLREIAAAFLEEHPEIPVTLNLASSGSLQQQIENGAPVDLFISAAPKHLDALAAKGLVDPGSRRVIATNTLVLIAPQDSVEPTGWEHLVRVQTVAMGEPASVPAGTYAMQALQRMGLWDAIRKNAVYAKDVRQVLVYVETRNAAAGFVYGSDARSSDKVRVVAAVAADSHDPITYDAALVSGSTRHATAKAFLDFLLGPVAQRHFANQGFGAP